jgi:hypothetical protein
LPSSRLLYEVSLDFPSHSSSGRGTSTPAPIIIRLQK